MDSKDIPNMTRNRGLMVPLFVTSVNGKFIIAVYQGTFSEHDILIGYRQKKEKGWSRIRTPKHIHWTVDMLIKMHEDPQKTREFINFLIDMWKKTNPIRTHEEKREILKIENLILMNEKEIKSYDLLGKEGGYSIKFLLLLARLLMIQEKTNLETAFMFENLLKALKEEGDIYKIISLATHRRR